MSKIVQVANAIISNPQFITEAIADDDEFFFLYKDKYRWSIKENDEGNCYLYFYPGCPSMDDIMNVSAGSGWDSLGMVVYSASEIGTAESYQTFSELFNLIKEKAYGIDAAFDDILSDMEL